MSVPSALRRTNSSAAGRRPASGPRWPAPGTAASPSASTPEADGPPVDLDDSELDAYREAHPLAPAMPVVRRLLVEHATADDLIVAVSDARGGRLLWVEGAPAVRCAAESVRFTAGARWDEGHAGTNAPRAGPPARQPGVRVSAAEHWARTVRPWSCAAVPLHHPATGLLLGALDVTGDSRASTAGTLAPRTRHRGSRRARDPVAAQGFPRPGRDPAPRPPRRGAGHLGRRPALVAPRRAAGAPPRASRGPRDPRRRRAARRPRPRPGHRPGGALAAPAGRRSRCAGGASVPAAGEGRHRCRPRTPRPRRRPARGGARRVRGARCCRVRPHPVSSSCARSWRGSCVPPCSPSRSPALLERWTGSPWAVDDLEAWQACAAALPDGPRRGRVAAHARRLDLLQRR